ncbi:MAG: outer membrane beta-barrel protein [Bacteroidia bacterium]
MKKISWFLTLFIGLGVSAFAQQGLKLGGFLLPQASVLLNSQDQSLDDDVYRLAILDGMAAGVTFGYDFNDYIGFRLNPQYSLQGGKYTDRRDIDSRNKYITRLEYLKIPLVLHFNSNPVNHKVVFVFEAGASIGLLTRARMYDDNTDFDPGLPGNISNFPSVRETYMPFTVNLTGGIGFDIRLDYDMQLNLRLVGDYSLQDVENKNAEFRLSENGSTVNQRYWEYTRGATRNVETFGITSGVMIGLTWLFPTAGE